MLVVEGEPDHAADLPRDIAQHRFLLAGRDVEVEAGDRAFTLGVAVCHQEGIEGRDLGEFADARQVEIIVLVKGADP